VVVARQIAYIDAAFTGGVDTLPATLVGS